MMETKWVKTSKAVYDAIWIAHGKLFCVHTSFTNMEPSHLSEQRTILTGWGFKDADHGTVKSVRTWDVEDGKEINVEYVYYLGVGVSE